MRRLPAVLFALALLAPVPARAQLPEVECVVPAETAAPELVERNRLRALGTGAGVRVGVIDTGVTPHEQLPAVIPGGDLVAHDNPDPLFDCDSHGTVVAGVLAGRDHGVAPGVEIVSVRQTSAHYGAQDQEGTGSLQSLTEAIHIALDHDAQVINISVVACLPPHRAALLDTSGLDDALARAEAANAVVVAANGNTTSACQPSWVVYPAHAPTVLAVGARSDAHSMAEYSLPAATDKAELSAPGAVPAGLSTTGSGWARGTHRAGADPVLADATVFEGTSFSAPVVSGAVALLRERYPGMSAAQLRDHVVQASEPAGGMVSPVRVLTHVPGDYARDARDVQVAAPSEESAAVSHRAQYVLTIVAIVLFVGAGAAGVLRRPAKSG